MTKIQVFRFVTPCIFTQLIGKTIHRSKYLFSFFENVLSDLTHYKRREYHQLHFTLQAK